jgi:hypothetical protein
VGRRHEPEAYMDFGFLYPNVRPIPGPFVGAPAQTNSTDSKEMILSSEPNIISWSGATLAT